jgi:hypothetical protein
MNDKPTLRERQKRLDLESERLRKELRGFTESMEGSKR